MKSVSMPLIKVMVPINLYQAASVMSPPPIPSFKNGGTTLHQLPIGLQVKIQNFNERYLSLLGEVWNVFLSSINSAQQNLNECFNVPYSHHRELLLSSKRVF